MTAPSLVEFLHARIAEDEEAARKADEGGGASAPDFAVEGWPNWEHPGRCVIVGVERWLAECEAKRRIIERFTWDDLPHEEPTDPYRVLRMLAAVYADHADYRQDWKP